ncbi:MAG: asparagine synthetase B, partial [Thermomicrobiaceae bacterium]|nr:asparagine synthetase B [Thermomicrobiaceae bacterium]
DVYKSQALGGGAFTFASEVKALLEDPAIAPRLNARALHYNISVRSIPGTETLFEGIHKLPAGHTMTLERGIPVIRPYWDLRYGPKQTGSEEEIAARLRDVLLETVHCHLLSDVPLGAFLSGGLDSTLVAAMMATLSDRPIKTFSVGVREQDFSELAFARLVAERYRTDHHEYVVEPDLIATLPAMLWHMEEPVDPFAFGVYAVARLARQHVKVALGGDGGDEMFAGYDRYLGNQIVDLYRLVPPALRRHVIAPLVLRLRDDYSYNNRVQRLRWLVAMSDTSAGERYAQSAGFLRFHDAHKRQVYTDALWRAIGDADPAEYLLAYFDADNASDAVDKMLYTDVRTRLADHSLIVVDRMTMAHSLEGRSPLVDQRLAEFAATIPAEMKLNGRRLT